MSQLALVADDDPLMRRLCQALLEQVGCTVISADNGQQAVELARRELPLLIILDVVMSKMTGLNALRELKQDESTKAIPVIMISGTPDRQTQETSAAWGAAAFFKKPFRAAEMQEVIRHLIQQPN